MDRVIYIYRTPIAIRRCQEVPIDNTEEQVELLCALFTQALPSGVAQAFLKLDAGEVFDIGNKVDLNCRPRRKRGV